MTRLLLALPLLLAATAHAEMCKPPNVPRAVLESLNVGSEPIVCPQQGFCWRLSLYTGPVWISVICFSPVDLAAAIERSAMIERGESP